MRHIDEDRLNRTYTYIQTFYMNNGRCPSFREILKDCHYKGISSVQMDISRFIDRNMLVSEKDGSIRLPNQKDINTSCHMAQVFMTNVPCGTPNYASDYCEDIVALPNEIFGDSEHYILHAKGESMVKKGIFDGDLLVVEKTNTAKIGDCVVALVEDETTAKVYAKDENNKPYLLSASDNRSWDIRNTDFTIIGVIRQTIHKVGKDVFT